MLSARVVFSLVLVAFLAPSADAHPEYQRAFQTLYTKGSGVDKDFRKLVRSAKCHVCHQGKEDRKNYNRYGLSLLDHLSDGDKKDKKKIAAAFEAVIDLPSDGDGSKTYAELIEAGQLPGGPLEESEVEPETKPDAATE